MFYTLRATSLTATVMDSSFHKSTVSPAASVRDIFKFEQGGGILVMTGQKAPPYLNSGLFIQFFVNT